MWNIRENGEAEAIVKLVDKLCQELRPQAVPLVDAFGIPSRSSTLPSPADVGRRIQ